MATEAAQNGVLLVSTCSLTGGRPVFDYVFAPMRFLQPRGLSLRVRTFRLKPSAALALKVGDVMAWF